MNSRTHCKKKTFSVRFTSEEEDRIVRLARKFALSRAKFLEEIILRGLEIVERKIEEKNIGPKQTEQAQ